MSIHPVRCVVNPTAPHGKVTLEQTQRTDRLHRTDDRKDKIKSNREMPTAAQMGTFKKHPKLKVKPPRLHSGAACDRPKTNKTPKILSFTEVVWQQTPETFTDQHGLDNTTNESKIQYTHETSNTVVAIQMSPPKGT